MPAESPNLNLPRLLIGLAGALFVAGLVLAGGVLIILGTGTEAYLSLERTLERFIGN